MYSTTVYHICTYLNPLLLFLSRSAGYSDVQHYHCWSIRPEGLAGECGGVSGEDKQHIYQWNHPYQVSTVQNPPPPIKVLPISQY